MPLLHTNFIEEPRQRQAESVIIMCLERAGLQHTDSTVGTDWRVLYGYRSHAELLGMGYRHEMHMNIRRPGTVDSVWTATARIHSINPDIGPVIGKLTSMLTSKFPMSNTDLMRVNPSRFFQAVLARLCAQSRFRWGTGVPCASETVEKLTYATLLPIFGRSQGAKRRS